MGESATTRTQWGPALTLFLLSPAIGELLSSSMPPAEFFNPFAFLLVAVLYGGGALLCRELTVRWGKGWLTLFILAAAYGIVEEGLMVKSFFNENWVDIGNLGTYGRWAGVNWVWSLNLTIYHAAISIATPVFLTGLLFPKRRSDRWLGPRAFWAVFGLLVADVLLGLMFFGDAPNAPPYRPPFIQYNLFLLLVVGLVWLGWRVPHPLLAPGINDVELLRRWRHTLGFFLLGLGGLAGLFAVGAILAGAGAPALATMAATAGWEALIWWCAFRLSRRGRAWSDKHKLALVSGALAPFVFLAFLWEHAIPPRKDNVAGMGYVGLFFLTFLLLTYLSVRRSQRGEVPAEHTVR